MNTIKRISSRQAIINFPDFDIRIFVKYRGVYCSAIRIWKLPRNSSFLNMLNSKNLIWAICDRNATALHGWFNKEPNLLKAIAEKVVQCKNYEELKKLLVDFERISSGEIPSSENLL
ncbi:MAG TPA: hypothetical protein VMW72_05530 [Sedimentisphaerales bacterium]|nr:hypothetical protein [Sedimentisphaerales bacterium]